MIKIYYHIAAMNQWKDVVSEQAECLSSSGILDHAMLVCSVAGTDQDKGYVSSILTTSHVIGPHALHSFEFPTLIRLHAEALSDDQILYIHTKGVSHTGQSRRGSDEWRRYMMWGCVERWRECLDALATYDMSGVQWTNLDSTYGALCRAPAVWGGNFWWANGAYISKLSVPSVNSNRWWAEGWPVSGKPSIHELHNLTGGGLIRGGRRPNGPNAPGFSRLSYAGEADMKSEFDTEWPYKSRTDVINAIIEKNKYRRYLEIGVCTGTNFNRIRCAHKAGVDPMAAIRVAYPVTSDEYFAQHPDDKWDIIFIDGLHTAEQVLADVEHGLHALHDGGCLVLHDVLPECEIHQRPAGEFYQDRMIWTGTVWRAWVALRMTRADLAMQVVDIDMGVGIIRKGEQTLYPMSDINWKLYMQHKCDLMNVVSCKNFHAALRDSHDNR